MATGLKHWLALVAFGMAGAVVWALPPRVVEPGPLLIPTHEEARLRAISSELRQATATLQRLRWHDSLAALVVHSAVDGVAFAAPAGAILPDGAGATEENLAAMRAHLAADAGSLARRAERMVFGYVFQSRTHGLDGSVGRDERGRVETFTGIRDGVGYCMRVRVNGERELALRIGQEINQYQAPRSEHTALGGCRPYLAHGIPGPRIQEWLASGGLDFALARAPSQEFKDVLGRRYVLGLGTASAIATSGGPEEDFTLGRCLSGLTEACATLFLDPGSADASIRGEVALTRRAGATAVRERLTPFAFTGRFLLADLEQEFGSEAFARFWTSSDDVERAFASAFGLEVGPWIVSRLDSIARIDPAGPGLGASATLGALLTLSLLAAVAYGRVRRHGVR